MHINFVNDVLIPIIHDFIRDFIRWITSYLLTLLKKNIFYTRGTTSTMND